MKQKPYDPSKIEKKWQKYWDKKKTYKTEDNSKKKKFYVLDMFPYPSGEGLHVGHPKGYIATDIISRMKRMQGHNVLHPMGFDAFGLPAENYAIKTKTNPEIAVRKNVTRYKKQLEMIGFDYDWSREVNTTDPKFYKWTQWIFLELLKKGLAFESNEPVNWCPNDKTVLSNEDVEDGKCERCGSVVEKKPIRQWVLKITDYAERLLEDLSATDYVVPEIIDTNNPPRKGKPVVERRNVHAIVYDPKTSKYLILRNKKHGWDTVIIGGIEDGEDPVDTALRELREETGYVDLEFKRQLGGVVKASYFAKHKDVNRVALSTALYFELKSESRVEYSTEGENEGNEVVWVEEKDFVPGKMVNSELPLWLERLGTEFTRTEKGIPCFTDVKGSSGFRRDMPTVERTAIVAIVKHWSKDQYIGLKWKKVNWQTLITGGQENGQTLEEAAIAEIIEETGYQDVKFVKELGNVDARFFHNPKNVNRHGHFTTMYFELKDGKRKKVTEEEQANHDVTWVDKEKMLDFLSPAAQRYIWQTLFLGEPSRYAELSKPILDWPESIKEAQRNWIGKSVGINIDYPIENQDQKITVFTTRPDTNFGATFLVAAPDGKFVTQNINNFPNKSEVLKYVEAAKSKSEIERTTESRKKTGVFTGWYAINNLSNKKLPIYVGDFVLGEVGTGVVVGVPGHDLRDFQFAKELGIEIKRVVIGNDGDKSPITEEKQVQEENGTMVNSGFLDGMNIHDATKAIMDHIEQKGWGKRIVNYKLKDWVFSRQRYWGEPIPIFHDENGEVIPVSEKDLPVILPKVKSYEPTGTGESPLANIKNWVNVKKGKQVLRRETNTMPQWAGSSWYYLRYMDPKNSKKLADPKLEKYWNQVDFYVGGAEHATRHLIYARFWHKFLFDIGAVQTKEPFKKLQSVGLIMAEDGRKMSKRFGNVINPDDIIKTWGADTLRMYEMFMGPFADAIAWNTDNMIGVRRFLEKAWKMQFKIAKGKNGKLNPKMESLLHKTIKKVTEDIEDMKFNTAISTLMIFLNDLEKEPEVSNSTFDTFLKLLAPFAPHMTEELWSNLGNKKSIHQSEWPKYDKTKIVETEVTIVVQVNGRVRADLTAQAGISEEEAKNMALSKAEIKKWLEGKELKKVIWVPNKVLNFVIAE